jgi:hypothetical protein
MASIRSSQQQRNCIKHQQQSAAASPSSWSTQYPANHELGGAAAVCWLHCARHLDRTRERWR